MLRLSIIIPFYNVEKYIAECLDSVFDQDIPLEEYEVICVNDGSPDHSRDIVLDYMKRYPNLRLVEHDHNRKLGAARNTGRAAAKGTYIWNVDSDDKIAPNCLGEMLKVCEEKELDVFVFSLSNLINGQLLPRECKLWDETSYTYDGVTFWKQQALEHQAQICPVWTQMYRREFLDEYNIYSPQINMGEDVPFTYASILLAHRIWACNTPYYIYRKCSDSLTGVIKKTPSPLIVYENSFICAKYLYYLLPRIPSIENKIFESVLSTVRYVIGLYRYHGGLMESKQQKELAAICRHHIFDILFVFNVLTRKQIIFFVKFLVIGRL